jgi:hypothetical protein
MVAVKGPALGLSPQNYTRLLGRTIEREIEEDEPFLDRDLGVKIALDVEHILPMEYGFTVRFRDFADLLSYQPRMLEFHFTDQDLDEHYPGDDFSAASAHPLKLVVHAPEF